MSADSESETTWSGDLIWVRRLMLCALSIQIIQGVTGVGSPVEDDLLRPSFDTFYRFSALVLTSFAVISGLRGRARSFLIGVVASQLVIAFGVVLYSLQVLNMGWFLHRRIGLLAWNAGVLAFNLVTIAVALRHLHVATPDRASPRSLRSGGRSRGRGLGVNED